MSDQYEENLDSKARSRYVSKLNFAGIETCPYKVPADQWIDDQKKWPNIDYPDVFHYLIECPRIYSIKAMKNYRSLEAHSFFITGLVQTVYHLELENGNFILKADVKPSWEDTADPQHPWVALKETGEVITAHCDCISGLEETCSHIGALLFKMEAAVRLGYASTGCIEPSDWHEPTFVKKVQPARIADIKFYKTKSKSKVQKSKKKDRIIEPPTEAEKEAFLDSLASLNENIVVLSSFAKYSDRFISKGTVNYK